MENSSPVSSKHDIIGHVIYYLNDEGSNVDSTIEGLFSRVFVKYDQYQNKLTRNNFRKHHLVNFPCHKEEEDKEEEDKEEINTEQDLRVVDEFETYWSENGQDIILKLWIEKYKDFVDPAYSNNGQTTDEETDNYNAVDSIHCESTVAIDSTKILDNTVESKSTFDKTSNLESGSNNTKKDSTEIPDQGSSASQLGNSKDEILIETHSQADKGNIGTSLNDSQSFSSSKNTLNSTQNEDIINNGDYSQQWDLLWQNHCVEVYKNHFDSFKQDWLKNLSETLDAVNNSTGLEYFELVKQEILATSQKQLQEKQNTQLLTKEDTSVTESATGSNQKQTSNRRSQSRIEAVSLGLFLENNLEEISKKYEELEEQANIGEAKVEGEINESEDTKIDCEIGGSEDNFNRDLQNLNLGFETKADNEEVIQGEMKMEQSENIDSVQILVGTKSKEENNDKEMATDEEYTSEEEVDIDEAVTREPASYNKFADQPNYLLNKLGLHFGSATSSGEIIDNNVDLPNTIDNDVADTVPTLFFKRQKLNLFVSKSKLHKLNHRLKIDTKEAGDEIDDGYCENEGYDEDVKDGNIREDLDGKVKGKPLNKHIYFNYSDEEVDEHIGNINIEEHVNEELVKQNGVNEISKAISHASSATKKRAKKENVVSTVRIFLSEVKSEDNELDSNEPEEIAKESNKDTEEISNESLDEINDHKKHGSSLFENAGSNSNIKGNICSDKETFNDNKQPESFITEVKSFNFTHKFPNSNGPDMNSSNISPVFVFQGQSFEDNSESESDFPNSVKKSLVKSENGRNSTHHNSASPQNEHSERKNCQDFSETISNSNEFDGDSHEFDGAYSKEFDEMMESYEITPRRGKNKRRRKQRDYEETPIYEDDLGENVPEEILNNPYLNKYYLQRYLYWSRYDEGIQMDEESWYSVTPEKVAQHVASRVSVNDVVVDAFCGCGGNTIQFALACRKVISIDIDPNKIRLAQHNASVYRVSHKIEFIQGDFFTLAPNLKADVVFLSPPWGGPAYARSSFNIDNIFPEAGGGKALYDIAARISPNVGYYLPRTTDVFQLIPLAGPGNVCEVEQNFVGRKFVAMTAYYGSLVRRKVKKRKSRKGKKNDEKETDGEARDGERDSYAPEGNTENQNTYSENTENQNTYSENTENQNTYSGNTEKKNTYSENTERINTYSENTERINTYSEKHGHGKHLQ